MSRTILLLLAGIAVVGAAAVLLLIAPATDIQVSDIPGTVTVPDNTSVETPAQAVDSTTETTPAVAPETTSKRTYTIDGTIHSGEYAHQTNIAGVDVYWGNDAQLLWVGLSAPGTGYVAIGFDPASQMKGANFIIAAVDEGILTIRDDYGFEALAHIADVDRGGQDNIIDAAGNQWPDQTVVEFVIPLDSGDEYDKPLVPGNTYTVLVSYHSLLDDFSVRHTRRGSAQIQLDAMP